MEQEIKTLLGEYAFAVAALQKQVKDLTQENESLKSENKPVEKTDLKS